MRYAIIILMATSLLADSRTIQRKADEKRVSEYHKLNAKAKRATSDMQAFVEGFSRDCQARGQELKLDSTGDPSCQNKPPAPASMPAAPHITPPTPTEK